MAATHCASTSSAFLGLPHSNGRRRHGNSCRFRWRGGLALSRQRRRRRRRRKRTKNGRRPAAASSTSCRSRADLSGSRVGMRGEANGGEDRRPRDEDQEHDDEEVEERPQRQVQAQRSATRPSSGPQTQNQQHQPPPGVLRNVGYVGKHRLSAAITRLDQELQSLQEELNELETMEPASSACQDVITSTEGKPDPLLPIGPENSSWDRWFQQVRSSRSSKWWASRGFDFS